MTELSAGRDELEQTLADSELYQEENKNRLQALLVRQGEIGRELEQVEGRWFELQEELELLDGSPAGG